MLLKAKSSKSRPRCRFANFPPKTMRAWLVYKKSRMRKYWEMWGQRRLAGNEIKRKKKKKNTDNSVDANSICWKAGGALREWYSFGTDLRICSNCIVKIFSGTESGKETIRETKRVWSDWSGHRIWVHIHSPGSNTQKLWMQHNLIVLIVISANSIFVIFFHFFF